MSFKTRYWLRYSILNIFIVAMLGVLMRYKIGFDFPYFKQKNILYAHSHFAFIGWITHTLYVLMINYIQNKALEFYNRQYRWIVILGLVCSYGMLISFFIQGYGIISIIFSTSTIVLAGFFMYYFFKDLKRNGSDHCVTPWLKAGLWFNILSSIGTFYLVYMIVSRNFNEDLYLSSVYFYLHFQYNGFFIFSCIGLIVYAVKRLIPEFEFDKLIFRLFLGSAIPAYFLSVLWLKLPIWLYTIVVISSFAQIIAWILFLKDIRRSLREIAGIAWQSKYLFLFVGVAFSVKLLLQLGSTIPELSELAFGFRPVVIAYLHLVLLAVVSVFLLSYLYVSELMRVNKLAVGALLVFTIGVFLNELMLAVQGIASFSYALIPYVNEILLGVSLIIMVGALVLVISQRKKEAVVTKE